MNKKLSFLALALLLGVSQVWAVDPRIEQGARFEAKGQYEKALGEYRAMLAENKKNTEAYMAAGNVRMKMKDYKGALANFRLAYNYDSSLKEAYEGAARAYEAMGQQAKADAERAKIGGKASASAAKTEQKVETKAAPAKQEVKTAAPAAPAPAKVETPKAAPVAKAEAPKAAPAAVDASEDPFEKGKALLAQGKYQEAAPLWRTVLSKKPGDAGAYFYAGVTRYEMGEYDKAEFNLKKGLSYKERGNDANYYLAKIYQKNNKSDLEKKSLAAYLKKAAPDAKFRKAAEDRMVEINAIASAAAEEKAMKEAEAKALKDAKKAGNDKSRSAEPANVATQNDYVTPTAANSIANANALFADGYNEAALQMYKALLENEITPDERYFAMLQMGNIYREMRDFHSAVTRYRDVVREFPDSDWATEAERALEDAVWLEKHASELPRNKR